MNRNQPINPLSRFVVLLILLLTGVAAQLTPAAAPPEAELQRMQTCGSSVTDITRILRQADLPFALSGVQLGTDPDCSPTGVLGSGTVSPALIKVTLARAGYNVNVDGVSAAPPDLFPAFTGETWPLNAEVAPLTTQRAGSLLKVPVRLQNWTVFRQKISWGLGAVQYILLNRQGEVVRWNGDDLIGDVGLFGSCSALQTCDLLSVNVPLDHFNPDLPLEPGSYTLHLRIDGVIVGQARLTATLPDQSFDILPR